MADASSGALSAATIDAVSDAADALEMIAAVVSQAADGLTRGAADGVCRVAMDNADRLRGAIARERGEVA